MRKVTEVTTTLRIDDASHGIDETGGNGGGHFDLGGNNVLPNK